MNVSEEDKPDCSEFARALSLLQTAVSKALRTGRIDDKTWEELQAALVASNREIDPLG